MEPKYFFEILSTLVPYSASAYYLYIKYTEYQNRIKIPFRSEKRLTLQVFHFFALCDDIIK